MTIGSRNPDLAKDVQILFELGGAANWTDSQLLERFAVDRDEAAFAEIVRRHGPMVFRTCRKVLEDAQDQEDAVQATFLVLIRKAETIRNRDSIAGWLHGTALRVSQRAKVDLSRRRFMERRAATKETVEPDRAEDREGWLELHEELAQLPERYRTPLVLCYLEGLTTETTARLLGFPQGTVLSQLARGRERLKSRLIRRGLTSSVAILSLARSPDSLASMPTVNLESLTRLLERGKAITSGPISDRVSTLTEWAVRRMFISKVKLIGAVVVTGALTITSSVPLFGRLEAQQDPQTDPARRTVASEAKPSGYWSKKLANGATVELLGISTHPSSPASWWTPSGKALAQAPYPASGAKVSPSENELAREFALSIKDLPNKEVAYTWTIDRTAASSADTMTDKNGQAIFGLAKIASTFPKAIQSSKIGFGVAAGPWETKTSCGSAGGSATGFDKEGIIFGPTHEIQGRTMISVSFTVSRRDQRIVAIDHDDQAHASRRFSYFTAGDIAQQEHDFDLPSKSIKRIEFQTRPYEWVEFADVPIQLPVASK